LIEIPLKEEYCGMYHQSFFTRESIHLLLRECGFKVIRETTYEDKVHADRHYDNHVLLCEKIITSGIFES